MSSSVAQVMSVRSASLMAMRSAWSLTASRMTLNVRRGPVAVLDRLAVEADHLAGEDVEPAGAGDGQRTPEQGVDKTEGGDTGADAESEGKHSGRGRDLVAAELPPAELHRREATQAIRQRECCGSPRGHAARSRNARRASSGSRPEAMASSMCDCNSSSISRFKRSPRNGIRDTRPQRHVMPPGEPD